MVWWVFVVFSPPFLSSLPLSLSVVYWCTIGKLSNGTVQSVEGRVEASSLSLVRGVAHLGWRCFGVFDFHLIFFGARFIRRSVSRHTRVPCDRSNAKSLRSNVKSLRSKWRAFDETIDESRGRDSLSLLNMKLEHEVNFLLQGHNRGTRFFRQVSLLARSHG